MTTFDKLCIGKSVKGSTDSVDVSGIAILGVVDIGTSGSCISEEGGASGLSDVGDEGVVSEGLGMLCLSK